MIEIKCTDGTIIAYPKTGVVIKGVSMPLVANPAGEKVEMTKGKTVVMQNSGDPSVGGKGINGGYFTVTNNTEEMLSIVVWHEIDRDPIYSDDMVSYLDMNGDHTDENYTTLGLGMSKSESFKTIGSNVQTVTFISPKVLIQPV